MGTHKKPETKRVIQFILRMGKAMGYSVAVEELMFPDEIDSPVFDITWRKAAHDKGPLFIFEVDSNATQASTNNALKVLSKKTVTYQKPLFLFHVFVEDLADNARIEGLTNQYDDVNYSTFALGTDSDHLVFCPQNTWAIRLP